MTRQNGGFIVAELTRWKKAVSVDNCNSSIIIHIRPDFAYIKWAFLIYFIAKQEYEEKEHNVGRR